MMRHVGHCGDGYEWEEELFNRKMIIIPTAVPDFRIERFISYSRGVMGANFWYMCTHKEAVLEAGPVRLRPILMTSLAIILGMIPTALAVGASGTFRSPMAIAVIGGTVTSTILSLVVVPVVYTLVDDVMVFVPRLFLRTSAKTEQVPASRGAVVMPEVGSAADPASIRTRAWQRFRRSGRGQR